MSLGHFKVDVDLLGNVKCQKNTMLPAIHKIQKSFRNWESDRGKCENIHNKKVPFVSIPFHLTLLMGKNRACKSFEGEELHFFVWLSSLGACFHWTENSLMWRIQRGLMAFSSSKKKEKSLNNLNLFTPFFYRDLWNFKE